VKHPAINGAVAKTSYTASHAGRAAGA
jgi:hypothetical protein